jgi:hypothetical protein
MVQLVRSVPRDPLAQMGRRVFRVKSVLLGLLVRRGLPAPMVRTLTRR